MRLDSVSEQLVDRMRTENGRASLRWTMRSQLDEYDLWPEADDDEEDEVARCEEVMRRVDEEANETDEANDADEANDTDEEATPMQRAMPRDGAMPRASGRDMRRRAGAREEADEDPGEDAFAQPEQRQSAPVLALPGRPRSQGATRSRPTS